MSSVYSDYEYRKRTAALKRRAMKNHEPCALCGREIDFTLPYTDRWSFTAEHSDPISLGGDLLGPILPAHRPEPVTALKAMAPGLRVTSQRSLLGQSLKSSDRCNGDTRVR